jgi:hypothetical protein
MRRCALDATVRLPLYRTVLDVSLIKLLPDSYPPSPATILLELFPHSRYPCLGLFDFRYICLNPTKIASPQCFDVQMLLRLQRLQSLSAGIIDCWVSTSNVCASSDVGFIPVAAYPGTCWLRARLGCCWHRFAVAKLLLLQLLVLLLQLLGLLLPLCDVVSTPLPNACHLLFLSFLFFAQRLRQFIIVNRELCHLFLTLHCLGLVLLYFESQVVDVGKCSRYFLRLLL